MQQAQNGHSKLVEYQRKRTEIRKSHPYLGLGIALTLFILGVTVALVWHSGQQRKQRLQLALLLEESKAHVPQFTARLAAVSSSVETIAAQAARLMPPVEAAVEFVLGEPLGTPPETGPGLPHPPPGVAVRSTAPRPPPTPTPAQSAAGIRDDGTPVGIMSIEEMERRLRRERQEPDGAETPAAPSPAQPPASDPRRPETVPALRQIGWDLMRGVQTIQGRVARLTKDIAETEQRLRRFAESVDLKTAEDHRRRLARELDDLETEERQLSESYEELPALQAKALELREEEAQRQATEREQRERVEAERLRRTKAREELAALDQALDQAKALLKQNKFDGAHRTLTVAIEAVSVAQPADRHRVAAEVAGRLDTLMTQTLALIVNGLRWGWKASTPAVDVVRADAAGVEIRTGRVTWDLVPLQQMLVFFEYALADKTMGSSVRAEYCVALAYLCQQLDRAPLAGRYKDMALAAARTPQLEAVVRQDIARILGSEPPKP